MSELVAELILSIDGFARGTRSPGYYGFNGPEFARWLADKSDQPHRNLLGRHTYELLAGLPDEARDDDYVKMTKTAGWVVSSRLDHVDWPTLDIVRGDLEDRVREWKGDGGPEVRIVGSLSLIRQLTAAGLVDRLRLILCPLVVPTTGVEPAFEGYPDLQFELLETQVLDRRVVLLDYRPAGPPPHS
ncbi:hypothetical protein DAERI_020309 [Deinococcus aerius]|uniref:Bacterial bifunctional deaminase-reductase C-terminal domain-containing protein n=1 Tax=Deinococcus aerius TaxID=200253 RepID=A0A2I9CSP5_9DEIO|nr:dihydrofolate reductase family protein [Deinococcus aerius]GBF04712.1 hypothetical protein DAERI_020309 [Deinococcus aerius]